MMQNNMWKKGIVLGIILLFVGVSVTPSISGNIGNINGIKDDESFENEYLKSHQLVEI